MEEIQTVRRKTLLNRSGITDYCCNYYMGCAHGCRYPCYARLIRREPYEKWIRPRVVANALEILSREIPKIRGRGEVMLCSMTDPYQPIDGRVHLTRRVMLKLLENDFDVLIHTKSSSALADIDVFRRYRDHVVVGFTIITLDDERRRRYEPYSSPISARIEAIRRLKSMGIRTHINIEPVLPETPISDLLALLTCLHKYVDDWWIGRLNYANADPSYYRKIKPEVMSKAKELGLDQVLKYVSRW